LREALALAEKENLDLVEIAPNAEPPVCKIIDFGKYRYDQTKKEKESKKGQHQIKVKEIKLKPNIDEHDFLTKQKQAKQFLEKGNKVKISLVLRGRETIYPQQAEEVVRRMCEGLDELGMIESPLKWMGRSMLVVIAPRPKKK
jgi:translation initiation factor IF-3